MRNKIWGIIKDKIHVDGTFNPLGLTYFKTSNAEQVDELTDAILQAIRDEVEGLREILYNVYNEGDKGAVDGHGNEDAHINFAIDQIKEALNK
jgi:hypothetical protein